MRCMRYHRFHWQSITTSRCPILSLQHIFRQNVKKFSRKAFEDTRASCIQDVDLPKGWMEKLVALGPDLAYVLASLAHDGQITAGQMKNARKELPSLSCTKWRELAPSFNLPEILSILFHPYSTVRTGIVLLPPSFHKTTAEAAWHFLDVYQEQLSDYEPQIKALDAYIIPIVGLFQGRINDEVGFSTSTIASGDEVEHELIFMRWNIFIIIRKRLYYHEGEDNITQLFLELLSMARRNEHAKFKSMRVYGLLTDLRDFYFYSYDQSQREFTFDETVKVRSFRGDREVFMADMIRVTNKIFTIVLSAYLEGLAASIRATILLRNPTNDAKSEKKQKQLELALNFAKQCLNKFREPFHTVEDVEKQGRKAIKLLTKSVCCLPRHVPDHFRGKEDPSTEKELRAFTRRIVHAEYMRMVGPQRCN